MHSKSFFHKRSLSVYQMIALGFLAVILGGTLLLALPVSSRNGEGCGLLTALFTATSAACVTGLALGDTWTQWSGLGQGVLLMLIQIGGLGFMSLASLLIFAFRREMNLRQLSLAAQSIGANNLGEMLGIQKRLLLGSLGVELTGALLLFSRFRLDFSLGQAVWMSVFHSVSAYCNAGFDLLGIRQPGTSVITYGGDPVILLTLAGLIVVGGIGFLVWEEVLRTPPRRWSLYTRLVLGMTAALLAVGMVGFCLTEWENPDTLGAMPTAQRLLAAYFQSATTRTAGFAGIDQGSLTDSGKALTMLLMFVGGSSGSTAGGFKTVTLLVLLAFLGARVTGRQQVTIHHRRMTEEQITDTLTLFGLMTVLCFCGGMVMSASSGLSLLDCWFETISALATVGLSTGITGQLSTASKIVLISYMYFGRVGILTLSMGFLQGKKQPDRYTCPSASLLIG